MPDTPEQTRATHLEVRVRGRLVPPAGSFARHLASFPALGSVAVLLGGPEVAGVAERVAELRDPCRERGVRLSADFVLDADADACAVLARRATSLGPVLELSRELRAAGVPVRWWIPVLQALAYRLEALFSLAGDEQVEAVLVPASMAPLPGAHSEAAPDAETRRFVRDFVAYRLLDEERARLSRAGETFYESLEACLREVAPLRARAQSEAIGVLELDDRREWLLRVDSRPAVRELVRDDGRERGTGLPARLRQARSHAIDVAGVFAEGGRALGQCARASIARGPGLEARRRSPSLARVLVIGAYGGDHIGDTAIAGGVLIRMHQRYQTRSAILVSQRPEHTSRLARMLDLPVSLRVEDYRQSTIPQLLSQVDGVVFGGGPLMDLPKQLVKHLYTVSRARRDGKPFIVEGIGAGPFIRRISAWTARRFVRMADRVTVRTAVDAGAPLVRGMQPVVGRDPAFDYLETRGPVLTRMPAIDRQWLDRLLAGTTGRVTVGVNLRPLRSDYTAGSPAGKREEYTRFVESRFEQRLAEAMRRFHRASGAPPCFIFFPMNAIQFGSSDLRSAYRISRLLGGDVDFRIWEADPGIDGVIELLRRVDLAITMRFHATIYAVSQQTPVIGIDYRPGKRDKVAALLSDVGSGHNCGRIDEVTTDWLVERLTALSPTVPGRAVRRSRDIAGSSPRPAPRHVPT